MIEPFVSIIVLAYNEEKYIAKALDSILSQERDFTIEIIVNDDCSTDNTTSIIKEFQYNNPSVINAQYHSSNIGAMKSYYNTLKLCRGKYIMALAGDDYWLPGKMKSQVSYMENNPKIGLCYGKAKVLKENCFIASRGSKKGERFEELLCRNLITPLTVCVRSDLLWEYLDKVKPQDRNWKMEDLPMSLWFSLNSNVHFIDEYVGVYRVVEGSVSRPHSIEDKLSFTDSTNDVCLFFAGDNKKYKKIAKEAHERLVASMYLAHNDIQNFRIHNNKGGIKGLIKNAMSFFPFGMKWLRTNATY